MLMSEVNVKELVLSVLFGGYQCFWLVFKEQHKEDRLFVLLDERRTHHRCKDPF